MKHLLAIFAFVGNYAEVSSSFIELFLMDVVYTLLQNQISFIKISSL